MNENKTLLTTLLAVVLFAAALLIGALILPWNMVRWGKISIEQTPSVTVTGTAKTEEKNQIANFSAGVQSNNDNRDIAISEVNKKIQIIIDSLKTSGINAADIKTQNLNVYQQQETYYEDGRQKTRPGQWSVNNTIEIKLRAADRAGLLADLLTKSGASNIYGPNFTLDDTSEVEIGLLDKALADARKKAEIIARSSGKKLGAIMSVSESTPSVPLYAYSGRGAGGGGGAPTEPGTGTIQKSIFVTYELR